MASFKLLTERRPDLYRKKYKFKVTFSIPDIGRTRYCNDIKSFKSNIALLRSKRWLRGDFKLSKQLLTNVENYYAWKNTITHEDISVRLDINAFSICSNDLNELEKYAKFFEGVYTVFKKADVELTKGVMYFKRNPPTNYRVYFKYTKVSDDFHKTLYDMINRYENTNSKLYPSKGLKYWIKYSIYGKNWIRGNFSIGYNNESDFTILALTIPEALGANYKLEKRID